MRLEVYLIIIGAAIGFLSSIGIVIVTDRLNKKGKLKLYYKVVFSKIKGETWGFHNGSDGNIFEVPLWVEIHNTSNSIRVVRDLNIVLYMDGKEINQMVQINKTDSEWFGNRGSYSFVVQPLSLEKYDLHFLIKKADMGGSYLFDEIWLRFSDEKDKINRFILKKIDQCWIDGDFDRDGIWKLAN